MIQNYKYRDKWCFTRFYTPVKIMVLMMRICSYSAFCNVFVHRVSWVDSDAVGVEKSLSASDSGAYEGSVNMQTGSQRMSLSEIGYI